MLLLRPAHPLSQPPQPSFTSRADTHKSWTRFIWQVPSSLSPVGASRHLSVYTSSFPPCGGETISGMHQKRTRDQKMREHLRCSWRSLHWLTPVESQDRQILQPSRGCSARSFGSSPTTCRPFTCAARTHAHTHARTHAAAAAPGGGGARAGARPGPPLSDRVLLGSAVAPGVLLVHCVSLE